MLNEANLLFRVAIIFSFFTVLNALNCYQCGSEAIFVSYEDPSNPPSKSRMEQLENTAIELESCSNLEYSSFASWGLFAVRCGPEQICAKTITDNGFDETGRHHYVTSTRGCAMRNDSFGKVHSLGCGTMSTKHVAPTDVIQYKWDLMCFCDTDYCNDTGANRYSFLGLAITSTIAITLEGYVKLVDLMC